MPKDLKDTCNDPGSTWDKLYRQYPHLRNGGWTLPNSIDLQSCCGLHIIFGLMPGLSYGNGLGRYDPTERNRQKFLLTGELDLDEKSIRKRTEDKIALELKTAKAGIVTRLQMAEDKPAGTIIAVTHAQFILIGKDLYDTGFIAIINNALSKRTNNRIILLFKVASDRNEHEIIKGFSYDEVMAAIDKYKLR